MATVSEYKRIQITIGGSPFLCVAIDPNMPLSALRAAINQCRPIGKQQLFLDTDNYPIANKDEATIRIEEIAKDGKMMLQAIEQSDANKTFLKEGTKRIFSSATTENFDAFPSFDVPLRPVTMPGNASSAMPSGRAEQCLETFDRNMWTTVFHKCRLFKGLLFDNDILKPSRYPICELGRNLTTSDYNSHRTSRVESYLTSNERQNKFIRSKLIKLDASFNTPVATLHASATNHQQQTEMRGKKNIIYNLCMELSTS
ncbi:unnamed protein product [Adineta ricciae]|uniref:Uncharacterized protein n=1 Tax=Adineta ricciae TaxID=249248 RepID=A0A816BX81_ADIRI|nr:unnamed protein product [Adineta ricciae]